MICPLCSADVETYQDRFVVHGDCPGGFSVITQAETKLESRYTPPRADCPHPERWHSDDWDSAEHEVSELIASLVAALRPNVVIETGAAFGQTSYAIGTVLAGAGVGVLHAVEISAERADITRKRCEGLPVIVEQMDSLAYVPPDDIGFAWFDSLLGLRVPEFRHYHPHFAPGALVAFHDTGPQFGPFRDEIVALESEGLLLPIFLPTPRGLALGEVVTQA